MTTDRPSVYLIDDHAIICAALRLMLRDGGFEVVGESGDPRRALEEVAELRPDIILLDITMPGLSGIDLLPKLRDLLPDVRIVMVTHLGGRTVVERSFAAGADGFVSKDSEPAALLATVRAVLDGERRVETQASATEERSGGPGPLGALTPREREILQLLVLGKTNKEVGRQLGVSVSTIKKHRENLQRKLQCGSTAELARIAIREGLIEP